MTLKGEKGETGGVEEYNKVDYMGNKYETLKQANDANVEYAVKTAIGEFNYLDYEGQHITATDSIEGQAKSSILNGFKYEYSADDTEHFYIVQNNLIVFVNKSNIPNGSIDEFKEFFYTNSRFIVYPLAQESVKTVDLSDNHVYSYKGTTYYDC